MLIVSLAAVACSPAYGDYGGKRDRDAEAKVALPPYPKPDNYLQFEVSATTPFAFFVDAKSLSIGSDGVVRYTLIAKSANGALNVSYEGLRCADGQYRVYAFGGADNAWSEARDSQWRAIRADPRNGERATLYSDYFCPFAAPVTSVEQALRALKSGGYAQATSNTRY